MWYFNPCENEDSCPEGSMHLYPELGTKIGVLDPMEARVVASSNFVLVPRGVYLVGEHVDYVGHQASVLVDGELVWLDLSDMHQIDALDQG